MFHLFHEPKNDQLILVNEQDEVIGSISQQDLPNLEQLQRGFVRAIGLFLVNDEGKVWIPRRRSNNTLLPDSLDMSVSEHVRAGENYETAAARGLKDDAGFEADPSKMRVIGKISPFPKLPYFVKIFIYRTNEMPNFYRDKYSGYDWLTPNDLYERLVKGESSKLALQPGAEILLQAQNKNELR
jgi:isopentenyldiphosphate isomerase